MSMRHDALNVTHKLDLSFILNSGDNIMLNFKYKLKHATHDKLHPMNAHYVYYLQLCMSSTKNNMEYLDVTMDRIK